MKMVLNKRDLERAFSPIKHRKSGGRRSLNKSHKGGNSVNETSSSMRVYVRIRPQNPKEIENNTRSIIQVVDENVLIFDSKEETEPFFFHGSKQNCRDLQKKQNKELNFGFDRVFGCNSSNEAVFEVSTKDIVKSLLDGFNCSVFAYGATGAGKTYTMLGSNTVPGITYLTIVELYKQMEILSSEKEFNLGVSHLEVYNENVQDLIQPSGPLHLREDSNYGVRIPGLSLHRITNADELFALMAKGNKNRTQHPTDSNAESSRSHSVFQLYIRMTNKLDRNLKIMKLSMIDLAGSERGSATGCKGMRFTEGSNINKSLLALGNCINSLAGGLKHIPYRDSKLTRLLKDSLGGNCQTVMIANVSPSSNSYEDTYNTLKYATRAKKIKQMIKKNIVSVQLNAAQYSKVVESLTAENEELKLKLRTYEAQNACQKSTTMSTVQSNHKEKLSAPYQELEAMNTEISKLVKEIKLLNWRNHVKQKIADRLPCLSINNIQLDKRLNRIKTSMRQLQGRESSFKQKLRETIIRRNDHFERINSLIKTLDQDGTNTELNQHIAILHLQLELHEKDVQLGHYQQLLSMQQNELQSEDLIVKEMCNTLKQYHFLLQGNNITTEEMASHYDELVHKLEGFKHISWKKDQETNVNSNFTFSFAEMLRENLCSEGIIRVETANKPPANITVTGSVTDCTGQDGLSLSTVLTALPDNELSESESEAGDNGQCGERSDALRSTSLGVSLSANETEAGAEGKRDVKSNSRVILETVNEDGHQLPVSQTSLSENTEESEIQKVRDKTMECCGILKEINLPVDSMRDVVAECSVTPLKVHCDTAVQNGCSTNCSLLNSTFLLPKSSPSHVQVKSPRKLAEGNSTQSKKQITVNVLDSSKKRNGSTDLKRRLCNKENRVAGMKAKQSAVYRGAGHDSGKDHTFTVPVLPQLRTSKPSTPKLTPISKHCRPVTNQVSGKVAYMKQRNQLNRAHPYIAN
ncbi:kinesin-like protein KIF18A [Zootermopsis nevadensis]|uniref:Kinesin-like protein KIF18A n=1 Tax=Zootermopsis nevadensis TaxID=136037 RepID=A0A067QSM4_ZOONE|nr:kinesin-like protein KIF18A [Zootermopsis nevadensis]KDR06177.1 Kinesin-like protein KIF18A [Zootermopsis nevadensis]